MILLMVQKSCSTWDVFQNLVNNGINYQPPSTGEFTGFQPSTELKDPLPTLPSLHNFFRPPGVFRGFRLWFYSHFMTTRKEGFSLTDLTVTPKNRNQVSPRKIFRSCLFVSVFFWLDSFEKNVHIY